MSKKNRPRNRQSRKGWNPDSEWAIHRQKQLPQKRQKRQSTPSYKHQVNQYLKQHDARHPEARNMVTQFMMGKFYMRPDVALRFAEYARAAALKGKEIGGMLRVQRTKNGDFIATDLKIFPQTASATFFEMDGREMNKWKTAMKKAGRAAELAEWNSLIHCHPPGCAPFLSGTDLDQIKLFGHRRHFWSVIVESDTQQIMNLNWRCHFYHGGMAPDADGMLAPASPPLLVKDIPVDILPSDWKDIHEEVNSVFTTNSSEFIGESETRARRQSVGFQRPSQQYAGPNPGMGNYLIGEDDAISDLHADDVPDPSLLEPFSEEDMAIMREAGITPEEVEAAMRAEFHGSDDDEDSEDVILITEGSIVSVNEVAMESYAGSGWADRVRDMVDSEFTVEAVTADGMVVVNDGVVLTVDAVDLVQ